MKTASALLLSMALACIGAPAAAHAKGAAEVSGQLLISGSSSMAPMMEAIAKRFSAIHPAVRIEVKTVGSGQGVEDVRQGRADIGMAARALTDKESGLFSFAIARDGVCLIVHKDNPIRSLTNRQVLDIYTGKVTNWSKVGGKDAPVVPINVKEGFGGSIELFTNYYGIRYADIKADIVLVDNLDRIKAIVKNPNGIAYLSLGSAQHEMDGGYPIKLLPVSGVAATAKNIRTGNFPISRPLLLITREAPTGLVKDFIAFSLSSQITDVVIKHDFVPYLD